jgi:hypothetical protein
MLDAKNNIMAEKGLQMMLKDDQAKIVRLPKKVSKEVSEERKRYAREYYQANKERILSTARQKRREAIGLGHYAFQD